jgi:hypothetical protein
MVAGIGFLFKNNIEIGKVMVFIPDQVNQIVDQVQEVEGEDQ